MAKTKVGDVRPIYQQVGWEVCKIPAEDPKDEEWIQYEKQAEAELLSAILIWSASQKKEKKKDTDEDN